MYALRYTKDVEVTPGSKRIGGHKGEYRRPHMIYDPNDIMYASYSTLNFDECSLYRTYSSAKARIKKRPFLEVVEVLMTAGDVVTANPSKKKKIKKIELAGSLAE